jgi:flagellar biosynthetic protein FliR
MTFTDAQLVEWISAWMWPFVRIAALVAAAPVFGHRAVPARVKLGFAVMLTIAVAPVLPQMPSIDPLSAQGLRVTAQQVLVGAVLGFAMRLTFVALELAGQQIAQLMGLGFASMVEPNSGANVPLVSQFYIVLATLVFLAIDGHLVAVEVLASSFATLPVAVDGIGPEALRALVEQMGWVFAAAVVMALPAVAALLTVNMSFGVITRTAPQLNIFAVGFPITLVFGFVVMLLTLPGALTSVGRLFQEAMVTAARLAVPGG